MGRRWIEGEMPCRRLLHVGGCGVGVRSLRLRFFLPCLSPRLAAWKTAAAEAVFLNFEAFLMASGCLDECLTVAVAVVLLLLCGLGGLLLSR